MTAVEFSPQERARLDAIEAAQPAPESFDPIAALRRVVDLCDAADDQPDGYECRFIAVSLIRDAIKGDPS